MIFTSEDMKLKKFRGMQKLTNVLQDPLSGNTGFVPVNSRQDLSGSLIGMNGMKNVYPVLIKQNGEQFLAYVADIDSATQGDSFFDAIEMARDLLGSHSLVADLPAPGTAEQAITAARRKFDTDDFTISDGIMTFVDIDTVAYRKKLDDHCVRKNVSLPAWLSRKADEAGLSLSKVLQEALLERLG